MENTTSRSALEFSQCSNGVYRLLTDGSRPNPVGMLRDLNDGFLAKNARVTFHILTYVLKGTVHRKRRVNRT